MLMLEAACESSIRDYLIITLTNCYTSGQRYVISCTASVLSGFFAGRVEGADISRCDSAAASVAFFS
jgi:hypothetical protein